MARPRDYDSSSSSDPKPARHRDGGHGVSTRRSREASDEGRQERHRRRSRSPDRQDRHADRSRRRERETGARKRDDNDRRSSRRHRSREDERPRHRRRRGGSDGSDDGRPTGRRSSPVRRRGPLPSQQASFAVTEGGEAEQPKEKPNFGNSGALTAAANSIALADGRSLLLKYNEPPEARKPAARDQWKLFTFKDGNIVDTIDLNSRSCWLVGRELAVVDMAAEHPSISKQHAVIQFRYLEKRNEYGERIGRVKPYLIDLDSANGSILNKKKTPSNEFVELRDKDMIQFGHSTREYVIMLAPRD